MFAGGLGMTELLVILVIVLIIFGAGKLPEIGAGLGKGIRNFRKSSTGESDEIDTNSKEKELPQDDNSKK